MTADSGRRHRAEYARRMNRVLDHIDAHLDQPLELAQLADIANFSRYHFHRVFAAWMGETLGDYARRRRLEKAAFLLACGHSATVLDAALATGFGSGEAFARAFKQKFGCPPSAWLQAARRNPDQARLPPRRYHERSPTAEGSLDMDIRLQDLPAVRVAYFRLIGPYGPAIGAFWRATVRPWIDANGLQAQPCYGVGLDDPTITAPDKCRYDACIALPDGFQPGPQVALAELPGGRYAVARFSGPPTALAAFWMALTRGWMPGSGLQFDDRPSFERFEPSARPGSGSVNLECDICIPVRPLHPLAR
jgi:AraC family transcriptional regulator